MKTSLRLAWVALGFVALILGIAGILLPLLPTTPFLILAAFAFSQSSERLHQWLLNHSVFGPIIQDWQTSGAISRRAKLAAALSMIGAFALALFMGAPRPVLFIQGAVLLLAAGFVLSRPLPSLPSDSG